MVDPMSCPSSAASSTAITGRDGVSDCCPQVFDADLRSDALRTIEQTDTVFFENRLFSTDSDGRAVTIDIVVRHRSAGGQLTEYRSYSDQLIVISDQPDP